MPLAFLEISVVVKKWRQPFASPTSARHLPESEPSLAHYLLHKSTRQLGRWQIAKKDLCIRGTVLFAERVRRGTYSRDDNKCVVQT